MSRERILIVEDDADIAFLLDRAFRKEGFETDLRHSGGPVGERLRSFQPDLVLLDLMLPDIDGYAVCRMVKEASAVRETKVIMLTAKSEEEDILNGFRAGADDYIAKPFHVAEVVARAKAVLRRKGAPGAARRGGRPLQQGLLSIDDAKHEVLLDGEVLHLTISEYKLLRLMAGQPDRVFTREQLSGSIADFDAPAGASSASRNIDVHIRSLRKKLGESSRCIGTVRGVGYCFQKRREEARA